MADLISMLAAAGGTEGEATDADFENTVLLLHGDGTNGAQNNTFLDSSTNNFTITRNGNTTQGSFSPFSKPDGRWGVYFPGSSRLSVPGGSAFDQDGNFTIEFWFYPANASGNVELWYALKNGSCAVTYNTSKKFLIDVPFVGIQVTSTNTFEPNNWYHVAAVRNGATTTLYVNGVSEGTTNYNFVANGGTAIDYICQNVVGYVSNMRFVKAAVYTSAFTPPTAPLTAIANTSVLMLQSNRFVDNNASPKTITIAAGTPQITPFSPFPITTAYDPAVNGGSGYFDGTGDYFTIPDNGDLDLGTGNFCVEFWWYPQSTNSQQYPLIGDSTGNWYVIWESGNISLGRRAQGNDVSTTGFTLIQNAWQHICVTRQSTGTNDTRIFVNGVLRGVGTSTQNYAITNTLAIGSTQSATNPITGYLSNVRVIKGSVPADYQTVSTTTGTSIFTPPTAPFTAVSGTELLCNFTNAGIFDNTGFNNLETVGNAQIDTTVKKYGTGSMEFDGTGDWLLMPNTPDQQLGTGNFTIEFWVYLASGDTGSNRGLVAKGTSTTGFLVSLNTTEKVVFTYATSTITSSGAITTNAWNHIAVVREGTGSNQTKIYIGGTNDGTGTVSTDFNQTSVMYVGANRTGGDPMKGFIDDLRITKGIARYTSAFTPPTAALPDIGT